MNEQLIKKLWHQAGATVSPLKTGGEWQKDFVQAYTELVVKECAKICHDQALLESENGSLKSTHKEHALDAIGCKITKHFGVEE